VTLNPGEHAERIKDLTNSESVRDYKLQRSAKYD
jgi:hypothetical protein